MIEHRLSYKAGGEWQPLPTWAEFFLQLGSFVGAQPRGESRCVVCVAVPTRAFAAAFAAAGAVSGLSNGQEGEANQDAHFDGLCQLPANTAVTYLHGGRNKLGITLGCFAAGGERWLRVQTGHPHNNSETHGVNSRAAFKVQVVPGLGVMNPLNLPYNQYGTLITPPTEFTCRLLGDSAAHAWAVRSWMRVLIVGRINHLRREVAETPFGVMDNGGARACEGTLQELARSRRLYGVGNKPYRSDIFPSNSRRAPRNTQEPPPLVVFDGSHGYLRWREHWRRSNWLVIMDVTGGDFGDARAALNGEYITCRLGDEVPESLPVPPEGVELVFYKEAVNG